MDLVFKISEHMATLIDSAIAVFMICRLLNSRFRTSWWHKIIGAAVIYEIVMVVPDLYWFPVIAQLLGVFIYAVLCYKGKVLYKLLIAFLYMLCMSIVNSVVIQSVSMITGMDVPSLLGPGTHSRIILLIFDKIVFITAIYFISSFLLRLKKNVYISSLAMSILIISSIVCLFVCNLIGNQEFTHAQQVIFLAIEAGLIALNIVDSVIIVKLQRAEERMQEEQTIKARIQDEQYLLDKIQNNYEVLRTVRHDTKHYYSILQNLLEKKKYDEAQELIEEVIGEKLKTPFVVYTSSYTINSVVNDKMETAKKYGIEFNVRIIGEISPNKENNIGIILCNLLDNAIEAEKKVEKGKILLYINATNGMCNIVVSNIIRGSILANNPKLQTSKYDTNNHGYGLKSVKHLVDEMDGTMEIKEEDNSIIFNIVL